MTTSNPKEKIKTTSPTAKESLSKRSASTKSDAKLVHKGTGAKKAASARRSSKTATILDMLKRPGGVTLKELMKTTRWQAHSVRGFLSGMVVKKMAIPVQSFKRDDGERAYLSK